MSLTFQNKYGGYRCVGSDIQAEILLGTPKSRDLCLRLKKNDSYKKIQRLLDINSMLLDNKYML